MWERHLAAMGPPKDRIIRGRRYRNQNSFLKELLIEIMPGLRYSNATGTLPCLAHPKTF